MDIVDNKVKLNIKLNCKLNVRAHADASKSQLFYEKFIIFYVKNACHKIRIFCLLLNSIKQTSLY